MEFKLIVFLRDHWHGMLLHLSHINSLYNTYYNCISSKGRRVKLQVLDTSCGVFTIEHPILYIPSSIYLFSHLFLSLSLYLSISLSLYLSLYFPLLCPLFGFFSPSFSLLLILYLFQSFSPGSFLFSFSLLCSSNNFYQLLLLFFFLSCSFSFSLALFLSLLLFLSLTLPLLLSHSIFFLFLCLSFSIYYTLLYPFNFYYIILKPENTLQV